jgi:hypothetical protein
MKRRNKPAGSNGPRDSEAWPVPGRPLNIRPLFAHGDCIASISGVSKVQV